MKHLQLLLVACLLTFAVKAQETKHIEGFVFSELSGRPLSEATVYIAEDTLQHTTDHFGYFNLIVSNHLAKIVVERDGYETNSITINADSVNTVNIYLEPLYNTEFTIFTPTSVSNQMVTDVYTGKHVIDRVELDNIPYIFSEPDLVKSLQIQPGVDFALAGYSNMTVRGGGLGQNQMLLDGAPIYSTGHWGGFISNFHPEMLEDVTLYKSAFPARFGGKLASVVDLESYRGNADEAEVKLAVSPAIANLNVGVPIGNGNSISFGLRRSYIDALIQLGGQAFFYRDFMAGLHLNVGEKNSLDISFYNLKDKFRFSGSEIDDSTGLTSLDFAFDFELVNHTISTRFNHVLSSKRKAQYTFYFTNYGNILALDETDFTAPPGSNAISEFRARFSNGEVGANVDFEQRLTKKTLLRYGLQNRLHINNSGSLVERRFDINRNLLTDNQFGDTIRQTALEIAAYIEDEVQVDDRIKLNAGLRTTLYNYKDFTGFYVEPRLSARYQLTTNSSFKLAYSRMNQFFHMYNPDGSATDNLIVWLPATETLKPQGSNIFSAAYTTTNGKGLRFLSEAYYKTLSNQPIYYAADWFDRTDVDANALVGTGSVMGWENSIKYANENQLFYASATIARARRTYDELNRGESFPFDYDRTFTGKAGFVQNIENFIFSLNGVYATGNPFTLPTAKYRDIFGDIVLGYDQINNYRANRHARVDMRFEWFFSDEVQSLELMIYNLLGTRNTDTVLSRRDENTTTYKYTAYVQSGFSLLPFITYRLRI